LAFLGRPLSFPFKALRAFPFGVSGPWVGRSVDAGRQFSRHVGAVAGDEGVETPLLVISLSDNALK